MNKQKLLDFQLSSKNPIYNNIYKKYPQFLLIDVSYWEVFFFYQNPSLVPWNDFLDTAWSERMKLEKRYYEEESLEYYQHNGYFPIVRFVTSLEDFRKDEDYNFVPEEYQHFVNKSGQKTCDFVCQWEFKENSPAYALMGEIEVELHKHFKYPH